MGSSRGTIVIAGAVARRPRHGGHTWVFLQYLLGFRALGWDVLLLDWIEGSALTDRQGRPCAADASVQVSMFRDLLSQHALEGALIIRADDGEQVIGLDRRSVLERVRHAAALINVMGYLRDEAILAAAPLRVFLDVDPGYPQMWRELGLFDAFAGHDAFVTVGERIGQPDCGIPTCGLPWITTPPPVVLDAWPFDPERGPRGLTSIATWRSPYGTVEYGGERYGPRAHELRRFADLPTLTGERFELALDIDPADALDRDMLREAGWHLVDPLDVAPTTGCYQEYIRQSSAEVMVAQSMYVRTRGGWFSDRSVCYLAMGRPVLAQDTGASERYTVGDGLLFFSTLDEAVAGARALAADPLRHARAARAVAETYFDATQVLANLLEGLAVG